MLGVRPKLKPEPCYSGSEDSPILTNMPTPELPKRSTSEDRLSIICHQLRYLTAQLPQAGSTKNVMLELDMIAFSRARSVIEYSLLSFFPVTADTSDAKSECTIETSDLIYAFEAQRLAVLIYLNIVLRGCSMNGALLQSLKTQLINAIQAAEGSLLCLRSRQKTAIWVFFMGGLISTTRPEQIWFAARIASAMRVMKMQAWEVVEKALTEVLWVAVLKARAWKLWQRAQELL